ncbi:hypothetical protein M0802_015020 [Mischocyttarus mexicanus]|nr:hypothetical protein M0802_015020 [Mischocyttarus mexicanus]
MPPSNNKFRIDSLVANVATLATAIAEIQSQVKSFLKPRDSCQKSVAVLPPVSEKNYGSREGRKDAHQEAKDWANSECKRRATKLAEALNKALPEAKVALPMRNGTFIVCGLDAGVNKYEIISSITGLVVGLKLRDLRVGNIYSGNGRCGREEHSAAACPNKPCCSVCKDAGRSAVGHVVGSLSYPLVPHRKLASVVTNKDARVKSAVVVSKGSNTNNLEMKVSDCTPTCAPSVGVKVVGVLSQDQRMAELQVGLAVIAEP